MCLPNDQLTTGFCKAYCNTQNATNLTDCFPVYIDYCFRGNNIYDVQQCQDFLELYVNNQTLNPILEQKLVTYCTNKYKGLEELTDSGDSTDLKLCGCHMQPSQYQTFADQLFKDYTIPGEGTTSFGIKPKCLIGFCAASPFSKGCTGPPCINIAAFNNFGNFEDSSVTIVQKQEDSRCAGYSKKTDPSDPSGTDPSDPSGTDPSDPSGTDPSDPSGTTPSDDDDQSFWSKYKWWIIIGGSILLVIIIIIVIVVATSGSKDKDKDNNSLNQMMLMSMM